MTTENDSPPARIEPVGRCAYYRPAGSASAGGLTHMITGALASALDSGLDEAVVNVTRMTGFESPGLPPAGGHDVGGDGPGHVRVALVARPQHVCQKRTGLIVAAEEGLDAGVVLDEADAPRWLGARSKFSLSPGFRRLRDRA